MSKFANPQTLERLLTLVKGYVDENVRKKMDSFTPGEGLSLENGILTVTLNTDLFKVVTSLPTTPAASDANKIFMVLDSRNPDTGNIYIEYLYTEQGWEEIGRRQVEMDMEPYLKKADLTATVSSTSFAIQKGSEQLGVIVFGSNDFTCSPGAKSLNVSLRDVLSATVSSGLYKIALDKKGRVTGYIAVQLSDLTALGVAKEADLQTTNQNLAKEVKDRQDAIKGVGDTITATKETLESADQALGGRIDTVNSNLETEQTTRQTEDGKLQQAINTVASNLETESQEREDGDTQAIASATEAAQGLVNAEKTARENADTALGGRIDTTNSNLETESSTRAQEDQKLQQSINTVAGNLETESQERAEGDTQAIASASALVETEKTARENADAALNTRTTALENALADRPIITSEEVTTIFNEVYS